nr:ribonuclease H-like domain-containing protein [Tanacetum cinerariifolium]
KGGIIILPPVSFEEHVDVQREMKARTLLLRSLTEDHMADFHHLDYAREIWLAVKARFGGNEESKKMRKIMLKQEFSKFRVSEEEGLHKGYDRFQKILSQLNQMQAKPDNDDVNLKFLKALPPSWSQVALTLKTRGGLEYLSFDDLYNKLRSLEIDVKGGSSYGSRGTVAPTHSAFIGATSTTTKMGYSDQPSHSSSITYTSAHSGSLMEDVLQSFVAKMSQYNNWFVKILNRQEGRLTSTTKTLPEELKAMVSVDSMLNWNEHKAEHKPEEGEQVYGLMVGFKSDFADLAVNAAGSIYDAAAEFAMMGISPKELLCRPLPTMFLKKLRSILAASRNRSASIHAGRSIPATSRNRSASIHAGRSISAASRNRPTSIHAGRHILAGRSNKPTPFPAG